MILVQDHQKGIYNSYHGGRRPRNREQQEEVSRPIVEITNRNWISTNQTK